MRWIKAIIATAFFFNFLPAFSQDTTTADGLFALARTAAFDQKDYPRAITLSKKAISMSPQYTDIHIFLGRVYSWDKQYDSAKAKFEYVLRSEPANEDAAAAFTDLEYWNEHYTEALSVVNAGLVHHPRSESLLVKKAKVLYAAKRFPEAAQTINLALSVNKKNTEARALADRINEAVAKNRLGLSYAHTYFDEQYPDPWNMVSIEYSRVTGSRSTTLRMNYAHRFNKSGVQLETDAYPRISKNLYAYVSAGYSADTSIFPRWRGGLSLYANLPNSFEAEAGTRVLHFDATKWLYTFYLGKYYKNFLFGARAFLSSSGDNLSQSYNLMARYYYGGADDFFALNAGTGISPDDRPSTILLNSKYKLRSTRVGAAWKKSFRGGHVISLNAGWTRSEYRVDERGNQYEAGVGYHVRF